MEDITQALAYQVKKDMAERYFGFRKRIETDTANYKQLVVLSAIRLENTLGTALIRIYILLRKQNLIDEFIRLLGLDSAPFFEPYTLESPTIRKRIFKDQTYRGFTRKRAHRNMLYDSYCQLFTFAAEYRNIFEELKEEQETISQEIKQFYRNNDIDTILQFIRRLDLYTDENAAALQYQQSPSNPKKLSDQIRLRPPLAPAEMLPSFPPLPEPRSIRKELDRLSDRAISIERSLNLQELTADSR